MAMTPGSWANASGTTTTGTTIANTETLVDELVALIQAADAGWSVATASTQYASATAVWARLTHSSGPAAIIVATLNASGSGTQIDAANTWDGVAVQVSSGGNRGRVWIAWHPSGVTAPSNDPSSASFFAASTDFRFIPLVATTNWSGTSRRLHVLSTSEGALQIVSQQTVGDGATCANLFLAANDLFDTTVYSGDTSTAGAINVTNTTAAATLTLSSSLCAGQCLNAAGSARVALNTIAHAAINAATNAYSGTAGAVGGLIDANMQQDEPYIGTQVWAGRVNPDVATVGVIAGSGLKGIINPYAIRVVPTSVGNKSSVGLGNYVHWAGGVCGGSKSTNVFP